MKTLTREEITAIRFRIKFDDVDLCVIDAPDLDKLLTLAESLISKPADNSKPDDEKPWEVDHEETESGSGKFHYYFIANERGKVVCDTLNSDVITIETDYDFGHAYSWDSQGRKDLTRLVECRNAMIGVEKPAEFMQAVVELVNAIDDVPELNPSNYHHDDVADCERAKGQMFAAWNRLRVVGGKAVS